MSTFPQGMAPLAPREEAEAAALRDTLRRVGSAFEFGVCRVADDVDAAHATPLDASAVVAAGRFAPLHRVSHTRDPALVPWFEWFCKAFGDPPYRLAVADEAERAQLFPRFCACTGLLPGEDIAVLDWVGDPEREPERSTWSGYFDDGKEWWGIWCLTVWNPRHRTLAAIAASQTD